MKRTRYMMPARSQGKPCTQRAMAEKDAHRWVFVYNMDPDVETLVRKWLIQRLDNFYCDLQVMYIPHFTSPTQVRTHVVLNNAPPLHAIARGLNTRDAVKAIVKATGLNPHLSVFGWPFCLNDVDNTEGGAM